MKLFELCYLASEPCLPPLNKTARGLLRTIIPPERARADVLDVGGRKSPYTIGVAANITVTDLPRETSLQRNRNLGITIAIRAQLYRRRSNIIRVLFDDMTRSHLPDCSFDCAVAIEVLEHVGEDEKFVSEVCRVLKPGGRFLITTPNGEFVENHNPDHKRHYTRASLTALLSAHFVSVQTDYAMPAGVSYNLGLRPWSYKHPLRTLATMAGGCASSIKAALLDVRSRPKGTHQLIALAKKAQ